jgi:hypothetical protein
MEKLIFATRINDSQLTGLVVIKQGSTTCPEVFCYCSEEVANVILKTMNTNKDQATQCDKTADMPSLKNKRVMKTREEARDLFKEIGLSYSDIGMFDINKLRGFLKMELLYFKNNGFTMKLCQLRKNDVSFGENGNLIKCFFRVKLIIKGSNDVQFKNIIHFTERECISFNQDGFIGFSGWADDKNARPFIDAFVRWVNDF